MTTSNNRNNTPWDDPKAVPGIRASVMSMTSPNGHLGFMFSKTEEVIPYKLTPLRKALVEAFSQEMSLADLFDFLAGQNPAWTRTKIIDELNFLLTNGLLEPDRRAYGDPSTDRWDRQLNFFGVWPPGGRPDARVFQERLTRARVTVIGIGGFGTHILTGLSYLGVGHVTAVDFDRVQASNLNRQILFTDADIGLPKTEVAEKRCRAVNPDICFKGICRRILKAADLIPLVRETDLVVFTADSPRQHIFSWMNRTAFDEKVPVLFTLGMSPDAVRAGPLIIPGKTPCLSCSLPEITLDSSLPPALALNRGYFHGTIEPYLMTGAGILLNEITAFLTGLRPCRLAGALLTLDMADYTLKTTRAKSRPYCPVCGSR